MDIKVFPLPQVMLIAGKFAMDTLELIWQNNCLTKLLLVVLLIN
jgi:hypothetical protein